MMDSQPTAAIYWCGLAGVLVGVFVQRPLVAKADFVAGLLSNAFEFLLYFGERRFGRFWSSLLRVFIIGGLIFGGMAIGGKTLVEEALAIQIGFGLGFVNIAGLLEFLANRHQTQKARRKATPATSSKFFRFWELFGYCLPQSIRKTAFEPYVEELKDDYLKAFSNPKNRKGFPLRWLQFCFLLRTAIVCVECFRVFGLERAWKIFWTFVPDPIKDWLRCFRN